MADSADTRVNLAALKRVDPYAVEIVETGTQVAIYKFNSKTNEWVRHTFHNFHAQYNQRFIDDWSSTFTLCLIYQEKTDIEGTLFLYTRLETFSTFISCPFHSQCFVILCKSSTCCCCLVGMKTTVHQRYQSGYPLIHSQEIPYLYSPIKTFKMVSPAIRICRRAGNEILFFCLPSRSPKFH